MTDIFPSRADLVNNRQSNKYSDSFTSSVDVGQGWQKNDYKNEEQVKPKINIFNKNSSSKKIASKPFKEDEFKNNFAELEYNERIRRLSKREKIV
jgi:hypothetical protein